MPQGYSREVTTSYQPTVIDPQTIPQIISEGKQVLTCNYINNKPIWFTSNISEAPYIRFVTSPQFGQMILPSCFKMMKLVFSNFPWETLATFKMIRSWFDLC